MEGKEVLEQHEFAPSSKETLNAIDKIESKLEELKDTNPEVYTKINTIIDTKSLKQMGEFSNEEQEYNIGEIQKEIILHLSENDKQKIGSPSLKPTFLGLLAIIQILASSPDIAMSSEKPTPIRTQATDKHSTEISTNEFLAKNESEESILAEYRKGPNLPIAPKEADKFFQNDNIVNISTFPHEVTDAKKLPGKEDIYCLHKDNKDKKQALYIYNSNKEMIKLFNTEAAFLSFSPDGGKVVLYNPSENETIVYDTENNRQVAKIKGEHILPYDKAVWSDNRTMYFFSAQRRFNTSKTKYEQLGSYSDLKKFDIETGKINTMIDGEKSNLASPTDLRIDNDSGKIYFTTDQNPNRYEITIK